MYENINRSIKVYGRNFKDVIRAVFVILDAEICQLYFSLLFKKICVKYH